jgi:hypothetical protein
MSLARRLTNRPRGLEEGGHQVLGLQQGGTPFDIGDLDLRLTPTPSCVITCRRSSRADHAAPGTRQTGEALPRSESALMWLATARCSAMSAASFAVLPPRPGCWEGGGRQLCGDWIISARAPSIDLDQRKLLGHDGI